MVKICLSRSLLSAWDAVLKLREPAMLKRPAPALLTFFSSEKHLEGKKPLKEGHLSDHQASFWIESLDESARTVTLSASITSSAASPPTIGWWERPGSGMLLSGVSRTTYPRLSASRTKSWLQLELARPGDSWIFPAEDTSKIIGMGRSTEIQPVEASSLLTIPPTSFGDIRSCLEWFASIFKWPRKWLQEAISQSPQSLLSILQRIGSGLGLQNILRHSGSSQSEPGSQLTLKQTTSQDAMKTNSMMSQWIPPSGSTSAAIPMLELQYLGLGSTSTASGSYSLPLASSAFGTSVLMYQDYVPPGWSLATQASTSCGPGISYSPMFLGDSDSSAPSIATWEPGSISVGPTLDATQLSMLSKRSGMLSGYPGIYNPPDSGNLSTDMYTDWTLPSSTPQKPSGYW